MNIIHVVLAIAVVGFLVWFITTYIPMPAPFKNIIVAAACIGIVLMLCNAFGIFSIGSLHLR